MARTVSPYAGPKESRTNSLGRAKDDCHTCSRTRQHCDRQRPRCGTCNNSGQVCGGYTLDLTWKAVTGGIETSIPSTQSSPDLCKTNPPRLADGHQSISSLGREFKFRVGKPKRPRKRPPENVSASKEIAGTNSTRNGIAARSPLNSESSGSPPVPQNSTQSLKKDQSNERTCRPHTTGGDRAIHVPSDTSDEDTESFGSNEVVHTSLVSASSEIYPRSSNFAIPPGMLFSSVAEKYKGVLQMCKLAQSQGFKL